MRITGRPAGPLGLVLLAATAVAGILLAVHGWSGRHTGLPSGAIANGNGPGSVASTPSRSPSAPPRPSSTPARSATPSSPAASPSAAPGPKLSSESYASYSYLVWPGTPSAAAQAALAGLSISVKRVSGGISVTAGVTGQPPSAPKFYAGGAQVYVVEASLGDDSGNSDYNLGDDALVVTDSQQRVLQ